MSNDSHNVRILAAAILAGCGGITIGLAMLPRDGSPASLIGASLIVAALLTIPSVWEHFVAAVTLPFAIVRNTIESLRAMDAQRQQRNTQLPRRKSGH
jgi:hypothetical protein